MKALALCATLTACLLAFASPKSLPALPPVASPPSDSDAIQGVWQRVASASPNYLLVIDGNRLTVQQDADQLEYGTFTLDATATPKTINARFENGLGFGIYELTGDTLRLCISEPGAAAARPTQFQSFGKSVVLAEFRRVDSGPGK